MAIGLAAYGPQLADVYSSAVGTARGLAELSQYQEQRALAQQLRSLWQQAGGDLGKFKELGGYGYLNPGQIAALESALASKQRAAASLYTEAMKRKQAQDRESRRLEAMASAIPRYEEGDVAGARRTAYLGGVEKNLETLFPEQKAGKTPDFLRKIELLKQQGVPYKEAVFHVLGYSASDLPPGTATLVNAMFYNNDAYKEFKEDPSAFARRVSRFRAYLSDSMRYMSDQGAPSKRPVSALDYLAPPEGGKVGY